MHRGEAVPLRKMAKRIWEAMPPGSCLRHRGDAPPLRDAVGLSQETYSVVPGPELVW